MVLRTTVDDFTHRETSSLKLLRRLEPETRPTVSASPFHLTPALASVSLSVLKSLHRVHRLLRRRQINKKMDPSHKRRLPSLALWLQSIPLRIPLQISSFVRICLRRNRVADEGAEIEDEHPPQNTVLLSVRFMDDLLARNHVLVLIERLLFARIRVLQCHWGTPLDGLFHRPTARTETAQCLLSVFLSRCLRQFPMTVETQRISFEARTRILEVTFLEVPFERGCCTITNNLKSHSF